VAGVNTYTYVLNDPVNHVDDSGLKASDVNEILNDVRGSDNGMLNRAEKHSNSAVNNFTANMNDVSNAITGEEYDDLDYKVCTEQAAQVKRDLMDKYASEGRARISDWDSWDVQVDYGDTWTFSSNDRLIPFPHRNIKATSSNPSDPVIIIDTWNGWIRVDGKEIGL
jgi:hypothetical protein